MTNTRKSDDTLHLPELHGCFLINKDPLRNFYTQIISCIYMGRKVLIGNKILQRT